MTISAINNPAALLQAQNAYNNTNTQKTSLPEAQIDIKAAESFHNMVNKNFNSFAKMSPQNIMAFAKQAQNGAMSTSSIASNGGFTRAFADITGALKKDEEVKRRATIGESSLTAIVAATSEAKTVLQTAVAVRNKVHEAFNKILDMPL